MKGLLFNVYHKQISLELLESVDKALFFKYLFSKLSLDVA